MKRILKVIPTVRMKDSTTGEWFTKTFIPKYKVIYIKNSILSIDGKEFKINERGWGYEFIYKIYKTNISVINIDRFADHLEETFLNAESPYVFEHVFDLIIKNVKPIN